MFGWKFIKEEFVPTEYYRIETDSINGGLLKKGQQKCHQLKVEQMLL